MVGVNVTPCNRGVLFTFKAGVSLKFEVDERYHIPKGGTIFRKYRNTLRNFEITVIFSSLACPQTLSDQNLKF